MTSPTVVRFAETFAHAGLSDLQEVFRAHLRSGCVPARGSGSVPALTLPARTVALAWLDAGFDAVA